MEYVLTTDALGKKYKDFKALNGLSMHIPKGSIYGFVGKNGSGKTTLIRLICGLQEPSMGSYSLYNKKNTDRDIEKARKRMGAVIESPSIYLDMSAKENLQAQYQVLGLPSFEGITELLELVGLAGAGKKKAKHFSLGMRQRLGIAVALAGDPDFLVLDEPTNGLDPAGIIEMRDIILKLNNERQITVLISSHILNELSKLATYYGFIDHGKIIKEMSAEELEKACRKCIRLTVSDVKIMSYVLDRMGLEYNILSQHEADIFGNIKTTELIMILAKENCEVLTMNERDEDLENYYINLIGGQSHE